MRLLIFLTFCLVSFNIFAGEDPQPEIATGTTEKHSVSAKEFMIVTANKHASLAANDIIKIGGNAVDAAIAAQMVLNVVEPQSSGIGGGGFILYYDNKTGQISSYDGRETAPIKANSKMFLKQDGKPMDFYNALKGGLSVGTPGLLTMLKQIHEKHGKLPWKKLFTNAINIAHEGFPISLRLNKMIDSKSHITEFEESKNLFFDDKSNPRRQNELLHNTKLAETFKTIANEGIEPFYTGHIAKDIANKVKTSAINPGYLSLIDLKTYYSKEREPICINYRKYKICSMAPPSSGGITIGQILGILENFNLAEYKQIDSPETIHLVTEATRLAYADRNKFIADSDFVKVPTDKLLSKEYLKERSSLIKLDKSIKNITAGIKDKKISSNNSNIEAPSTTHISIIDKEGNAISMTTSIEHAFGSGILVRGFLLNNQLTDFSFEPEIDGKKVANRADPKKRPRSSMSPTLVFDSDDNLIMVIGSPGGSRIIPYIVKTLISVLDFKIDLQEAINLPHYLNISGTTELEPKYNESETIKQLEKLGHNIKIRDLNSGIHAIMISDEILIGAADPRREGTAIGN